MRFIQYLVDSSSRLYDVHWGPYQDFPNLYLSEDDVVHLWLFAEEISAANIRPYSQEEIHRSALAWVCSEKPLDYINAFPPPKDWPDEWPAGQSWDGIRETIAFPDGEFPVGRSISCLQIGLGTPEERESTISQLLRSSQV